MKLPLCTGSSLATVSARIGLVSASAACTCDYDDRDGCYVSTNRCKRGLTPRCRTIVDPYNGPAACTCQCK